MLVFRSVSVGLLGAVLYFVAAAPPTTVRVVEHAVAAMPVPTVSNAPDVTIVDIAPGIDIVTLVSLVKLDPGERIVTVDGRPVENNLVAGAAISARAGTRSYVDLEVASRTGKRRVLLLLH